MRFYSLGYWDVMDTPLKAFWELSRNIDRLQAEEDLRRLEGAVAAASTGEQVTQYQEALRKRIGTVVVEKAVFDSEGLHSLKGLGNGI